MSHWRLIDSGSASAWRNMALDEALAMKARVPVLRLYGWSGPSVSIGCFQSVEEVDLEYAKSRGVDIVRRITGGRGILHGQELTYSFSAPTSGAFAGSLRKSYMLLGRVFANAFEALGVEPETCDDRNDHGRPKSPLCFKSSSIGEIKLRGRKIVGSAQKRWPGRFLQQGSIPFEIDFDAMSKVFRNINCGDAKSHMIAVSSIAPSLTIDELKLALVRSFEDAFEIGLVGDVPTEEEEVLATELEVKYRSEDWNLNRLRQVISTSR